MRAMPSFTQSIKSFLLGGVALGACAFAGAYTGPGALAPGNNGTFLPPINEGAVAQTKTGGLSVASLTVNNPAGGASVHLAAPSSAYSDFRVGYQNTSDYTRFLAWGTSRAFEIRNYAGGSYQEGGHIEFRPDADYTGIYPAGAASGKLILGAGGGEHVHITSSGFVGVGNPAPTQTLDVTGYVKATEFCIGSVCKNEAEFRALWE